MADRHEPWPGVRFAPETLDMFCRDFGERPEQAVADVEALNAELSRDWSAYRTAHPRATVRDFALQEIHNAALEMALLLGLPRDRAREVARRARAEAAAARAAP